MRRIGIYGGSFNPIHTGHVQLGDELIALGLVDELWYVVSPQNPFKVNQTLLDDEVRLLLAHLAVAGHDGLKVSDVELHLPRPSYMYHTLQRLVEDHPDCEFSLVIGADNWERFPRWYNYEQIRARHRVIVYPRPGCLLQDMPADVVVAETSLLPISSTQIREAIADGTFRGDGLAPAVWQYIREHKLYGA